MRHWIARHAAVVLSLPALLTGCGGGRSGSSSVSPCFRVLPQAHAAVGGQGSFVDVARIRGRRIDVFPGPVDPEPSSSSMPAGSGSPRADNRRDVCIVAYRGTFAPALIQHLNGAQRSGTYAIVVVGVRTQRVRGVFLTDHLPLPLRRH